MENDNNIDISIQNAATRALQVDNCLSELERALIRLGRRVKRLRDGKSLGAGDTGQRELIKQTG